MTPKQQEAWNAMVGALEQIMREGEKDGINYKAKRLAEIAEAGLSYAYLTMQGEE